MPAVRRIHERMGARMHDLHGVRRVYNALLKNFVASHGPSVVAPARTEPLAARRTAPREHL